MVGLALRTREGDVAMRAGLGVPRAHEGGFMRLRVVFGHSLSTHGWIHPLIALSPPSRTTFWPLSPLMASVMAGGGGDRTSPLTPPNGLHEV